MKKNKKMISLILVFVLLMACTVTSYGLSKDDNSNEDSDSFYLNILTEYVDCTASNLEKNNNQISYDIKYSDGLTATFVETKLDQNVIEIAIREGDYNDVLLYNQSTGELNLNGNPVTITTIVMDANDNIIDQNNSSDTLAMDEVIFRAIPQWRYSDSPFGGTSRNDYTTKYKTYKHTVNYGNPITGLSVSAISGAIVFQLGLVNAVGAGISGIVGAVGVAAAAIKKTASPYVLESKVTEVLWKIPKDLEVRYKHGVEYFDTNNVKVQTSIHYSMFV